MPIKPLWWQLAGGALLALCLAACGGATPLPTLTPPPASVLPLSPVQYLSPLPAAQYVSPHTTLVVRYGPALTAAELAQVHFNVQGSATGLHTGQTLLADDDKTVIFKPAAPFAPGERVTVQASGLSVDPETSFEPLAYQFTVAVNQAPGGVGATDVAPATDLHSAFPTFLTLPDDIPHYTVRFHGQAPSSAEGDILVAPFYWTKSTLGSYLLILNNLGQIVYYQSMAAALAGYDFKVQPNGQLSYYNQKDAAFYLMDSHYQVVDTIQAGDGYTADLHDLQLLPNGNALLMAYDAETIDMSQVITGGNTAATVTGLVIQELDKSRNVIFEWRSWDHFAFGDTTVSLTEPKIDLVHGNALAVANDGNLLLSSRNQSEITKIDLQTGDILWRLGGKASTLQLIGGQPFAFQHDVRQLPNGDITIFDNQGTTQSPTPSLGLEYRVDEAAGTATQVWSFAHTPPVFGTFMGNDQRLPDGNIFLDWGAALNSQGYDYKTLTEVGPDGQAVMDLAFDAPYVSYRAYRSPWQGFPDTLPALAAHTEGKVLTLGYSWNGATSVAAYRVFGGASPQTLGLIEQRARLDFETQTYLVDLPPAECYFQVAALDQAGRELARSNIISTSALCPALQ